MNSLITFRTGLSKIKWLSTRQKPKTWYFVGLILLNLICLIRLTELLRTVLLSFVVWLLLVNWVLRIMLIMWRLCCQHMYLLKRLWSQGLPIYQLHMVFVALILSRIICALPACGGHLTRQLQERQYAFLKWARKISFFAVWIIPRLNYLTRQMLGF